MRQIKTNQKGFSAVELLLTLIFLALIVFIGVYVAANLKNKHTSNPPTLSSKVSKTYFDFKDLGIKFIPDQSLYGLSYTPIQGLGGSGTAVYVNDSAVTAAFDQCQADAGANAIPADQVTESSSFASIARTPGSFSASEDQLIKQYNGTYISISFPSGNNCAGTQADQDNWLKVNSAAKEVFQNSLKSTITQD